jgi:PAS domain S-box-containing protein
LCRKYSCAEGGTFNLAKNLERPIPRLELPDPLSLPERWYREGRKTGFAGEGGTPAHPLSKNEVSEWYNEPGVAGYRNEGEVEDMLKDCLTSPPHAEQKDRFQPFSPEAARRTERAAAWDEGLFRLLAPGYLSSLRPVWRYGLAVLIVAASTLFRWALIPWLGTIAPYDIAIVATVVTAGLLGFGPGLLSVLLGDIAIDVIVLGSLPGMFDARALVRLGAALTIGVFITWILHAIRVADIRSRRSEERIAAFAAATFEGIVESEAGRIVDCNAQFAQMVGRTVEELKGTAVVDLVVPEERERVAENVGLNRESAIEHGVLRKDGTRIIVETHGRPAGPDTARRYKVVRDITERKQAEDALQNAKAELEVRVRERTAELEQANELLREENRERLRTEQLLRLQEARLEALWRLSQMGEVSLTEIAGLTLEQGIALTESKIGFVGFLSGDESVYTLHAVSRDVVKECGVTGEPLQWHVVDAGIWADAIKERRTLFVNDYSKPHPRKRGLPPGHPYVNRFMIVPILEEGKAVAVAGVGNKTTDYDRSDERQIALLLTEMWSSVQRNRSREALQKAHDDLEEKVRERTASLRESEQRLKRAQEIAHLGSWELDLVRNRLTWSDEVYRIFGFRPQEFGATYGAFLEAVHPEDRAAVEGAYSDSLREGRDRYEIEHRIVRRDNGEVRTVHEKCEHVRDAAGRVIRSIGMVHDITERKKTDALRQALAEQERLRLGAAVEQASDSVVMVDLDGTILYVNAAFESIHLVGRDEALGLCYFDLFSDDPSASAIRRAVGQGKPWQGQLTRSISGGRPVELDVTISPARDPSGAVIGGLVTETDVTQKNALQRQVRQAQKMEALGTLAGGITHDFNNILGTIIINTEMALFDLEPSSAARRPLPLVLQAANRGKDLVKQIITFSRQRAWERKPLAIVPIVKEGVKFLRSTLPKDIAIQETIDTRSGVVLADPSHIHQIMVNLCQNAALAMRESGGRMEVRLEPAEVDTAMTARHPDLKRGPYVRLTVADTGCGMTGDVMERIFEPFFTTRKPGEGSGLGLAVVHGIVKSYNGAIIVYSEPGKGSVFNVYLPQLEEETRAAEIAAPRLPAGGEERILLVEDEEGQRTSLAHGLERLGYRVTARADGLSALSAFRDDPGGFDIVITDQIMPDMSGLELAAALSKVRPDIPVILCTGFSEKVNEGTIGQDGIRELLMKPFTIQEITQAIRKAVRKENEV